MGARAIQTTDRHMGLFRTTAAMSSPKQKENPMKSLACMVVCLVLASSLAYSQGIGSSGDIQGTVTDPSGALLPRATITVLDTQTGLRRAAMTDSSGQFRVTNLAPAVYDVSAQASGFAEAIRKGVVVSIGQTVVSDFQLKVSQVATQIEVP